MKTKIDRDAKGITLIALVITIIVLLILAGVSISMLTGENGILKQAADAKDETDAAAIDEAEDLADLEDMINQYVDEDGKKGPVTNPYDPDGWDIAYTYTAEDGWSNAIEKGNEAVGDIVAKLYATGDTVDTTGNSLELPEGKIKAYSLVIEGKGQMGKLVDEDTEQNYAWRKDLIKEESSITITEATICDGITNIGAGAFLGCIGLDSIEITEDLTSIEEGVFAVCTSLTSIEIPQGVTSIEEYAFNYCTSLTSIDIPQGVTSIGEGAFYGCTSLTRIEIPQVVTSIGRTAFRHCESLTSIEIPQGVTSIDAETFEGCKSMTTITIPKSVKSIEKDAFAGCTSLTDIYYSGTQEDWDDITKSSSGIGNLTGVKINYNYEG